MLNDLDYLETRNASENSRLHLPLLIMLMKRVIKHMQLPFLQSGMSLQVITGKKLYDSMQKPAFIFDGRNILNAKEFRINWIYLQRNRLLKSKSNELVCCLHKT